MISSDADLKLALTAAIVKAWSDDGFRSRLLTNAPDALRTLGYECPPSLVVRVVERGASSAAMTEVTVALPPKPAVGDAPVDRAVEFVRAMILC